MKNAIWRIALLAAGCCLVVGAILFSRLLEIPMGFHDFQAYWSASYLLLNGRDPYDQENLLEIQRAYVDSDQEVSVVVWNPPTTFVFLLPLAWLPFRIARPVWLLVNISLFLMSCFMLGSVYLPPGRAPLLVYILLATIFPPVSGVVGIGQITFLILFGVAASVFLIRRKQFFWAGAALFLGSVKPHLIVLLAPYLLLYMAVRRKWSGWAGAGAVFLGCVVVLYVLRPNWMADFQVILKDPPVTWNTPTIGGFLALYGFGWTRYIIFAFLLMLPPFLRQATPVSLETTVSILTLVTIPTTFFGWGFDQSLLLLPIAQIVGWLFQPMRTAARWALSAVIAMVLIANFIHRIFLTVDVYYFWVPLAWALIYALAWRLRQPLSSAMPHLHGAKQF